MKICIYSARLAVLALALPATSSVLAQSQAATVLKEVVVTDSRVAGPRDAQPFGTSVITAEDIERSGAVTVNEAVMRILGVSGRQDLFGGGDYALDLRGFGITSDNNQVVIVDGIRINEADLTWLIRKLEAKQPHKVPGTAVFLTGDPTHAPTSLMHNLKHNRILHERNIILNIQTVDTPRVQRHERVTVERIADGFIRVIARYGFMETPSIPKILEHCRRKDLNIELNQASFFLSRRSLKPTDKSDLYAPQERLFIALAATATDATEYFRIPSDRVVEVGTQVLV